jgi:hypothetical protein
MKPFLPQVGGLAALVLVLGLVTEVHAAVRPGVLPQRRGRGFYMPAKPVNVDSSPTIDALNRALKALGETDREYDGHREKAIAHIGTAIQSLELPTARGKSTSAVDKAAAGKPATATKTATTPDAAADESLRKAKDLLFKAHHQLADHTATKGQLKADAQVRLAINEIVAALNPPAAPSTKPAPATAGSTASSKPSK